MREIIIFKSFPCRRHVVRKAPHLAEVLSNGRSPFLRRGKRHARVDDAISGLGCEHPFDGTPNIYSGGKRGHLRQDLLGQRGQQIVEYLLVLGDPLGILGVGDEVVRLVSSLGDLLSGGAVALSRKWPTCAPFSADWT
jgi:hypothetical protein